MSGANEDKKPCRVSLAADWDVLEKLEADTLRLMVVELQNLNKRMIEEQLVAQCKQRLLGKPYSETIERLTHLCDVGS